MLVALILLAAVQTYLLLVIATKRAEAEPFVPWPDMSALPLPKISRSTKEPTLSDEPAAPWGL